MELNTQYWGEGVYSGFKDLYYAGTDSSKTIQAMLNDSTIELNDKLDPSAFYSYSYGSKIASMIYSTTNSSLQPDIYYVRSPFANYGFIQNSGTANVMAARLYIDRRIAYGQTDIPSNWDSCTVVTRYALSKIRACCYVCYYKVNDITSDFPSIVSTHRVELKDFLASAEYNEYVLGGDIIVYQLSWKLYVRGDAGVHAVRDNLVPAIFCEYSATPPTDSGWQYSTDGNKIYGYLPTVASIDGGFRQGGVGEDHAYSERASDTFTNTSDLWTVKKVYLWEGTSRWRQVASLPPENLMKAFHEFAFFGLYYTNNTLTATNYALSDDDLFLGVISPITGATSGKYVQFSSNDSEEDSEGKARTANTPAVDDTDPMEDPNPKYEGVDDPNDPRIDPNTYVTDTPLSTPTLSPIDVFNRTFAMTAIQIRALADFLWNADDDKMTEIIEGLKLYGENPLNGLIDCRLYPFDLSGISEAGQQIIVGRVNTEVYGRKVLNTANVVFDLGTCKFMKYFNNFLDYAPYTTGRLFLPYCGLVPIDTAEFMGKEISCKLIVDLITGACCCCIFLDGILTITANGICGVEISMTGTGSASYANAVVSSFANGIVGVVGAGAGALGGAKLASVGSSIMKSTSLTNSLSNTRLDTYNKGLGIKQAGQGAAVASGAGGIMSALQSFWEAQTTPVQYAQRGSSTPSCETWLPQYPYFIVDSPITDIPSGYGHNVGFACIETGQLSSFSGFTICSNVDTSGFAQATEAERSELKTLLEAGVFL